MNDREIKGLAIVGGAVLLGFALLNGVYQAGVNAGLARDGDYDRGWGLGCFPFPLLLIGGVILFLVWRRRGGFGGPGGPGGFGPGGGGPPRFFEEWHRKAHEAGPAAPPTPAPPQAPRPESAAGGAPTGAPSGTPTAGPTAGPTSNPPTGGGPAQGGMV
jgi:hypothetical protein